MGVEHPQLPASGQIFTLDLEDLSFWLTVGWPEREREQPQQVLMTLRLLYSIQDSALQQDSVVPPEDITRTLDYSTLVLFIEEYLHRHQGVRLLESLACSLTQALTHAFPQIITSHITLRKTRLSGAAGAAGGQIKVGYSWTCDHSKPHGPKSHPPLRERESSST